MVDVLQVMRTLSRKTLDRFSLAIFLVLEVDVDKLFDIVFYMRMKDGVSQVIVNLEAQKDEPADYHILNRAVFYVSRLVF